MYQKSHVHTRVHASDHVKSMFLRSYEKNISHTNRIILAVSGGIDSMVLLDCFLRFHPRENIVVTHFDHQIRGDASRKDRDFVENFCKERKISCILGTAHVRGYAQKEKKSLESAARDARYTFLFETCQRENIHTLVTAHHLDDRIETALFHFIRGTKLRGLHALREENVVSFGNHTNTYTISLIHPFIQIEKALLTRYAEEERIPFREDSTNTDTLYLRNYMRKRILPEFTHINPQYRHSIERFLTYSEELSNFLDQTVRTWLTRYTPGSFQVDDFTKETPFLQREIVSFLYHEANHGTIGLSEGNLSEVIRYIMTAKGGTEKSLQNFRLTKQRGTIFYQDTNVHKNIVYGADMTIIRE